MTLQKYDGSEFVPAVARFYDNSNSMPWWRGVAPTQYDGSQFVDTFLNNGLELHYDFTVPTVSAGSVADKSGNANDGVINNSTETYQDQAVGRELVFDGSDDHIAVPHDPSLDVQTGDFTIHARGRIESLTDGRNPLMMKKDRAGFADTTTGYGLTISTSGDFGAPYNGSAVFYYGDGSNLRTFAPDSQVSLGGLYALTVRFRASDNTVWLYLNGVELGSTSFASSPADNDYELVLGAHYNGSGSQDETLLGGLSDVRIYSRLLTVNEVDALAQLGRSRAGTYRFTLENVTWGNSTGYLDPIHVYDPDKANPYQMTLRDTANSETDLFETSSIDGSWTKVADNIVTHNSGSETFQSAEIVNDTYYVYASDDTQTYLWTGPDFQSLSSQGVVLSDRSDGYGFHESGTWYLFVEAPEFVNVSGRSIELYTSSDPASGFTLEGTVLDFNDWPQSIKTGDPGIYKDSDGVYWMLFDVTNNHPNYTVGVARSEDLLDWELVETAALSHGAGDIRILDDGTNQWAYGEFADPSNVTNQRKGVSRFGVSKLM